MNRVQGTEVHPTKGKRRTHLSSFPSLPPPARESPFRLYHCISVKMNIGSASVRQFPVLHRNLSLEIEGNKTEVIISRYEDQVLVVATQIGTMGTILHARKEEGMSVNPTFHVSVIFGKRDEPMLVACARQLIEHMSFSGSSRPLLLSLGLKDHSTETLKGIVSAVIDNRLW